ncbi:hypothetical protein LBMAG52_43020 [Planctomycetia bacterium]|nr:hypothetical protein LBMAG52_43020 [Planctomycetia bacterium]
MVRQAFMQGLAAVRVAGLAAKGNDVAVLAAQIVFERRSVGKENDSRFPVEGPLYAERLILEAFAAGATE